MVKSKYNTNHYEMVSHNSLQFPPFFHLAFSSNACRRQHPVTPLNKHNVIMKYFWVTKWHCSAYCVYKSCIYTRMWFIANDF